MAIPWHISEQVPPVGIRYGNWMIDVSVDRLVDHCPYVNRRHVWALPRRLRIERAFELERETDDRHDYSGKFIRPMRLGNFGVALNYAVTHVAITTPEDLNAIRMGICNREEWLPFDAFRKDAPHAGDRFEVADLSDKGRYLLGVLNLFETLPDAFEVLMHSYWSDVLRKFGGVPVEKDLQLRELFIAVLRKRLGKTDGPISFDTPEDIDRLGREALRFGRMVQRAPRYLRYAWLNKQWQKRIDDELKEHPPEDKDYEEFIRNEERFGPGLQFACQSELLFQGLEWHCRTCFNRNWVGIEELGRSMDCEVCGHAEPAPVSSDWHFRPNSFVIEAYRDHGTETLIWALWKLWGRAQRSFYFAPSLRLWLHYPESGEQCAVEIDAVVVVDGRYTL